MKLKKVNYALKFVVIAGLLSVVSCKPENPQPAPDTTKPTITLVTPSAPEATLAAGNLLALKIKFNDDRALGACKIEVHNAFDGHTHGKTAANPFAYDTTFNLSGTEQIANVNIPIPAAVASGPYHIVINCFDKEGNEADFVEIELALTNESSPKVESLKIDGAAITEEIELDFRSGPDTLKRLLTAALADADGLDSLKLIFTLSDHSGKRAENEPPPIWKISRAIAGQPQTYDLAETLAFLKTSVANDGHYVLLLNVRDKNGNYKGEEIEIHVLK